MVIKRRGLFLGACILFSLFLLLLSYNLTIFFYPFTVSQQETLGFLRGDAPLLLPYSSLEISHLEDVRGVMQGAKIVFLALAALAAIGAFLFLDKYPDQYQRSEHLYFLGKWSSILLGALLALLLLFFPLMFMFFHLVFFPQGNWLFSPSSLLIQTFPQPFFIAITGIIFSQAMGYALLLMGIAWFLKKGAGR